MVALFLLFPRIGPLWGVPQDAAGKTGLSGLDADGRDGRDRQRRQHRACASASTAACRRPRRCTSAARCCRASTAASGRASRRANTMTPRLRSELQLLGPPLRYEMTLEPSRLALLPLLELTPDRSDAAPQLEGIDACAARRPAVADRAAGHRTLALPGLGLADCTATARADDAGAARACRRCRPATTRARWPGPPRCAARPDLAQADARTLVADALLRHIRSGGYIYTLAPGTYGKRRGRRVLARPQAGLLRALRGRLRRRAAGDGRAGARRHRLPGHRPDPGGRLLHRAPEQCPRLGRILAAGRRLGARRPDRRRRAGPHRAQPQPAAAPGPHGRCARQRQPAAAGAAAQRAGRRSTTAGTSGC